MAKFLRFVPFAALLAPTLATAHEVYVLKPDEVTRILLTEAPNPLQAAFDNKFEFFLWGFIAFVTVSTIFCMSIFRVFEERVDPLLNRLKRYAPLIERVTFGLSLVVFAYNSALFGPELPLANIYGSFVPVIQATFYIAGALITIGLFTREAAFIVALLALLSFPAYGIYMFTYTAYFVVAAVLVIMGSGTYSLDRLLQRKKDKHSIERLRMRFERYEMLALRIGFGFSVIAAAVYAKYLHSNLALEVVNQYHLTNYFKFDPLFVVLGALIIECLIGLFIMFGVEIRWTALFFLFWLTLSLLYFGESVWPHLALFGLNFMLFAHGYDRYTLEGRFFKRHGYEPVF